MIIKNKYLSQEGGTCCFVIAAANCLIHNNLPVPDLEKAYDIAGCRTGSTINYQGTIDYLKAPLTSTDDYKQVLEHGGIFIIMHPIWNGHAFFMFPYKEGVVVVNSWLGPNVTRVGKEEICQFLPPHNNLGLYWKIK